MSTERADGYAPTPPVDPDGDAGRVRGFVRPIIPVVWVLGAVMFVASVGIEMWAALAALIVTHLFFAGLVLVDVRSLRRQGVDWGRSRHAWVGAALILPFAALAYYVHAGRRIAAANRTREANGDGVEVDGDDVEVDGDATVSDENAADPDVTEADENVTEADENVPEADEDVAAADDGVAADDDRTDAEDAGGSDEDR